MGDVVEQTVERELNKASPCVKVWNETAQRLLYGIQSTDARHASSRLTHITSRLNQQQRICSGRLEQVEQALGIDRRRTEVRNIYLCAN